MIAVRACLLVLFAALFAAAANANERIDRFDVTINVQTDGDIIVTEEIAVYAEGVEIRRGIFRDLPRYFESDGAKLSYAYDVQEVNRDGKKEHYETETDDNAYRIRIGDKDVFLPTGPHAYEIRYRVRNQVRYFDNYDEVYWNATGNYWAFPILSSHVSVALPPGAHITATKAYTGGQGATGSDYTHKESNGQQIFETTRELNPEEGLTVAVGFDKGLIDPPSSIDKGWAWWQRNGSLVLLVGSLVALLWFYVRSFDRVGRDPIKGPVFPLYEPPKGCSPAAVHHIYYRGLRGHTALIATLMNLAVKGQIKINASKKKLTIIDRTKGRDDLVGFADEDAAFERRLFASTEQLKLDGKYSATFTSAYTTFRAALSKKYGDAYFRWNVGYTLAGIALTAGGFVLAVNQASVWTVWHTYAVMALAVINVLFLYLMPAPTPTGQKTRTEIEGFRLYMETAEKLQLNAVKVGSDAPPPISKERYETFLPYAVALGVEKPWTHHFEQALPGEAENYSPGWTALSSSSSGSLSRLNDSLISSMSSGVSSALPQSSSSSGSGGGGSSGGGGGGGGGGGW